MSDTQAVPAQAVPAQGGPAGPGLSAQQEIAGGRDVADAVPLLEVSELVTYYPVRRTMTAAVTRTQRRWVHAVDGVTFSLARGEMMALVGESGCGKTSTVQTIMGMVKPNSGAVRLNGTNLAGLSDRQMRPMRRKVQMIYQDPYESLDPRFRVRQTVEEPMLVHAIGKSAGERRELAIKALEQAGLTPAAGRHRRCASARAGLAARRRAGLDARCLRPRWRTGPARWPAPER